MDGIASIGNLASFAAQPSALGSAAPAVVEASAAVSGDGASGLPAGAAAQYQMSVLSKVMYASADQALALIAMLPQSSSLLR